MDKTKVLIVDDDKAVRDFLRRLVSILGAEVFEAEDGFKAVEMAKNEDYDLYFLDVRMPGIDGLETFRQIRKIYPSARIIMITGYAVEDTLEQAQKEGISGIIRKPFNINELKVAVDTLIKEKGMRSMRVLVIDDDEAIIDFFSSFLKDRNIGFSFAVNRIEALKAVQEERYDLIFLDLVFEKDSGLEIYEGIKGIHSDANIVLMSGYSQRLNELGGKLELTGCLNKPFDIGNVISMIKSVKTQR